jgi:hypothetical protein
MYNADEQFEKLGLILPPAPKLLGVYKPCLIDGKYMYLSGHSAVQTDGTLIKGRIGKLPGDTLCYEYISTELINYSVH